MCRLKLQSLYCWCIFYLLLLSGALFTTMHGWIFWHYARSSPESLLLMVAVAVALGAHAAFLCEARDTSEEHLRRRLRAIWYPFLFLQLYVVAFLWDVSWLFLQLEKSVDSGGGGGWLDHALRCAQQPSRYPELFFLHASFATLCSTTLLLSSVGYHRILESSSARDLPILPAYYTDHHPSAPPVSFHGSKTTPH
jgi:hypothetical protein